MNNSRYSNGKPMPYNAYASTYQHYHTSNVPVELQDLAAC